MSAALHSKLRVSRFALIACAFAAASYGVLFAALGQLPMQVGLTTFVLAALGGLVVAASGQNRVASQRMLVGLLAVVALSFLVSARGVLASWASIANSFIRAWDAYFESYMLPFRTTDTLSLLDVGAAALCLAAVSCLLVWALMQAQKSALVLGLYTLLIAGALFCGVVNLLIVGASLAAELILAALLSISKHRSGDSGNRSARGRLSAALPFCGILVLGLMVGIAIAVPLGNWSGATQARSSLMSAIDEARFGSDTLPEGQFAKAHAMNRLSEGDDAIRLEATFESPEAIEQAYFRGFIGSTYQGSSFEQPTITSYEGQWNGLFGWLEDADFNPLLQGAHYKALNYELAGQTAPTSHIELKAINANRRYGYAPYQASAESSTRELLDLYLQPTGFMGLDDAVLETVPGSQASEAFVPENWVLGNGEDATTAGANFLQAEHAYRSFVHDTYLALPGGSLETDVDVVRSFFFESEDWDASTDDLYTIATRIRSMLESQCVFTADPAPYSASHDGGYVSWFLTDEKRGNACAFAAASVLAFREAGIPARYVEGYLLNQPSVEVLRAAEQETAQLTSREAHAWVEVYLDGAGWTPVEMTPGFYEKTYTAEQTITISKEVAGDGSESELSGSLDGAWDDWIPEELRPFAWVGLLLLVIIIAFVVYAVLELQRAVRRQKRHRKLENALHAANAQTANRATSLTEVSETEVSAMLAARLKDALLYASPRQRAAIEAGLDYQRVTELLQRERFGAVPLNEHEAFLVVDIVENYEACLWKNAPFYRRFMMRYARLFTLPI